MLLSSLYLIFIMFMTLCIKRLMLIHHSKILWWKGSINTFWMLQGLLSSNIISLLLIRVIASLMPLISLIGCLFLCYKISPLLNFFFINHLHLITLESLDVCVLSLLLLFIGWNLILEPFLVSSLVTLSMWKVTKFLIYKLGKSLSLEMLYFMNQFFPSLLLISLCYPNHLHCLFLYLLLVILFLMILLVLTLLLQTHLWIQVFPHLVLPLFWLVLYQFPCLCQLIILLSSLLSNIQLVILLSSLLSNLPPCLMINLWCYLISPLPYHLLISLLPLENLLGSAINQLT